ncbi:MAG: helix-turn-helix domain-containing protein [Phycisphaeraceae bacterium]|nr:helix-turn-helix domain-containing protein [Phycisphaeraceae bacterium]
MSPSEVARAIGVSESSLKRWVDEGRVQASKTAGGHRRIPVSEAIRLVRTTGLPIRHPELLGLPELNNLPASTPGAEVKVDEILLEALTNGHAAQVRGIVFSKYIDGMSMAEICDRLLSPAMNRIGDLWHQNAKGIYIEHRATDITSQTLQSLRTLVPRISEHGPVAIGGAPSGDAHTLASLMAAAVIGAEGFSEINLGGETPLMVLADAARLNNARLVWLAMNVPRPAAEMNRLHREVIRLMETLEGGDCRLVIGGNAVPSELRRMSHEQLQYAANMAEFAAYARGMYAAVVGP